ncbi:hypothetical protein SAMN05421837_109357 [Amycolatopsis pretoriensis]|uniref:Zinc-finger n=1 Tax=Amycolatopsis pretoriensis TaxID=218821 RepID=A0A1H5RCW8_9PSEU|nr:zf-HC2 domain-containing protein [Amycolatopsis pretoriensis]SEF36200.1 hypothetical protein SAMN05421837_109357 [Amycolatopsis pretoriensis]
MKGKHREAAAYELGVLDDAEEFETHLRGCARCRELLEGFHPVSEALEAAARLGYLPRGGPPAGGLPASGEAPDSGGSGSPASDGSFAGTVRQPGPGYPAPSDGAARRRKPCSSSHRRGMATGALVLLALGVAVTAVRAARPATARTWFASAASIVSPAQVVAGTGHDLRDLPWSAGFQ